MAGLCPGERRRLCGCPARQAAAAAEAERARERGVGGGMDATDPDAWRLAHDTLRETWDGAPDAAAAVELFGPPDGTGMLPSMPCRIILQRFAMPSSSM